MKEKLTADFFRIFGEGGEARCFFAPGRVNLIGEHTDYNGGHVFPCALTIGTYAVARRRADRVCRFFSENFEQLGILETSLDGLRKDPAMDWANYPLGVVWAFGEKGMKADTGFDLLLYGNIPNSSGLSSSASVEVVTGVMLRSLYGFEVSNTEIALLGQTAENRFVGMNCGIMDQFVIANGKEDCAVFLDTATLAFRYAPVVLERQKIVIVNTNKRRGLKDSKYNERRAECETALAELQTKLPIRNLCDLDRETFDAIYALFDQAEKIMRQNNLDVNPLLWEKCTYLETDLRKQPRSGCYTTEELKGFARRLAELVRICEPLCKEKRYPYNRPGRSLGISETPARRFLQENCGLIVPATTKNWTDEPAIRAFMKDPVKMKTEG